MKKIISLLITILSIVFVTNVKAITVGDEYEWSSSADGYMNWNSVKYYAIKYNGDSNLKYFMNTKFVFNPIGNRNESINAFCIDPSLYGPLKSYQNLKVWRVMLEDKNHYFGDTIFYYMLQYINEKGYDKIDVKDHDGLLVANLALKAVENGVMGWGRTYIDTTMTHQDDIKATTLYTFNTGVKWATKYNDQINQYVEIMSKVTGSNYNAYRCLPGKKTIEQCRFDNVVGRNRDASYSGNKNNYLSGLTLAEAKKYNFEEEYSVESRAEEIFRVALERAIKNDIPKVMTYDMYDGAETIVDRNWQPYTPSEDDKVVNSIKEFKIKVKNANDKNYIKYKNYTCADCAINKVRIIGLEYNDKGIWKPLNTTVNLLTVANEAGDIQVRLKMNKTIFEDCSNSNFQINFEVKDSVNKFKAIVLKLKDESEASLRQRYMAIVPNQEITTWQAKLLVGCSTVPCETKISTPICSYKKSGLATVEAPKNIKKCIINNRDEANNSYQSTELKNNSYCAIFCKEDYAAIKFNEDLSGIRNFTVDEVNCGTYFKLTASVNGTKSCYTGGKGTADKSINKEKFEEDLDNAHQELVNAYNNYLKIKTASEAKLGEDLFEINGKYTGKSQKFTTDYSYTCDGDYKLSGDKCVDKSEVSAQIEDGKTTPTCPNEYDGPTWRNNKAYCTKIDTIDASKTCPWGYSLNSDETECEKGCNTLYCKGYEINGEVIGYRYDPKSDRIYKNNTLSYSHTEYGVSDGGKDNTNCSTASDSYCTDGSSEKLIQNLKSKVSGYAAKIVEAQNKLNRIIAEFNSCTTEWKNDFKFEQKIQWEYGKYLNGEDDYQRQYYNILSEKDKYLTKTNSPEPINDNQYCVGNADNEYNCLGQKYSNSSSVMKERDVLECNTEGCKYKKEKISIADYVYKKVTKMADYITPTVFYQIHPFNAITTINVDGEVQTTPIENGLPVSTESSRYGIYSLNLKNFGEFYEFGTLGRIFDYQGKNENKSLGHVLQDMNKIEFDGDYKCDYTIPCEPTKDNCPDPKGKLTLCDTMPCVTCISCLFNYSDIKIHFKSISTSNFYSTERKLGFNWDITWDPQINTSYSALSLIRDKASRTINEIQKENETIYREDKLDFSVELTPNMIRDIKQYNKEQKDFGGYANDSVTCYNIYGYNKLVCYSDFLDELYSKYKNNFKPSKFTNVRIQRKEERKNSTNHNDYWQLYTRSMLPENSVGGPAWK